MKARVVKDLQARRASSLRMARILTILIFIGGVTASLGGLLLRSSAGYALGSTGQRGFTNLFGDKVELDGQGLYRRDSFSAAAQERAQDLVTLVFALPLLAAAFHLSGRGSLGGRLMLSGALGYFLYCYGMMAVGTDYNEFFLLYVALFASSLYAFILSLYAIDADDLALACEKAYPRRGAAALCIAVALFLGLNWLGGVVLPSLLTGKAPAGIDASSTLFVQAFDLGILVPAAALCAFWLLRRDRRGYLVGTVLLVKGAAEGLAVSAMGFNMIRVGVTESLPMVICFLVLALCAIVLGLRAVLSAGFVATSAHSTDGIRKQGDRP